MITHTPRWSNVFGHGSLRALRLRPALPLYLASLVLGIAQAWPLLPLVGSIGLRNPFINDLAQGGGDAYANLFLAVPSSAALTGLWTFALLVAAFLYAMAYNFFAGGIIAGWRSMNVQGLAACRRYFWTFTGLQVMLGTLTLIVGVIMLAVAGLQSTVTVIVLLLIVQLINSVGELARAYAVIHDRRNPFEVWGAAVRFGVRHLPGTLALTFAGFLLHGALVLCAVLLS
ncbi:MAG: hypothetical protein AVDCRST_MAG93-7261, partial [uncultured Chloroflexia bacterium]